MPLSRVISRMLSTVAASLIASFLFAQQTLPPPPQPEPAPGRPDFPINVTSVQIPVTVQDKRGDFVNGLTAFDFQVLDGNDLQTARMDVDPHPVSLVIAIQADASTSAIVNTVRKSAALFGPLVAGETGEVAVLSFDDRIQVLTPFTSSPEAIRQGFAKLQPGHREHHLDDAAMEAVNMLRSRGKTRKKILILISETRDKGSQFTKRDVLTNMEFAGVQVYAIEMNHLLDQLTSKAPENRPSVIPPEAQAPLPMGMLQNGTTNAQNNMGNLAPLGPELYALAKGIFVDNSLELFTKFTGGHENSFASVDGLEHAVHRVSEDVHNQYLLTFTPSNKKGGYHEITVNILTSPDYKISTRGGFWYAPQGPDPEPPKKAPGKR